MPGHYSVAYMPTGVDVASLVQTDMSEFTVVRRREPDGQADRLAGRQKGSGRHNDLARVMQTCANRCHAHRAPWT